MGDTTFVSEMFPPFQDLIVYPNPASTQLTVEVISASNQKEWMPSIQDLTGRLHRKEVLTLGKSASETIDIQDLNPGIYILSLENGNERVTKRFIKLE